MRQIHCDDKGRRDDGDVAETLTEEENEKDAATASASFDDSFGGAGPTANTRRVRLVPTKKAVNQRRFGSSNGSDGSSAVQRWRHATATPGKGRDTKSNEVTYESSAISEMGVWAGFPGSRVKEVKEEVTSVSPLAIVSWHDEEDAIDLNWHEDQVGAERWKQVKRDESQSVLSTQLQASVKSEEVQGAACAHHHNEEGLNPEVRLWPWNLLVENPERTMAYSWERQMHADFEKRNMNKQSMMRSLNRDVGDYWASSAAQLLRLPESDAFETVMRELEVQHESVPPPVFDIHGNYRNNSSDTFCELSHGNVGRIELMGDHAGDVHSQRINQASTNANANCYHYRRFHQLF